MQQSMKRTALCGFALAAAVSTGTACASRQQPAPATRNANVEVALIGSMAGNTVTWTDGKLVPSLTDNTIVKALPGPEHRHTAMLASNAVFYTPDGCTAIRVNIRLDAQGLGTVPCTKEGFIQAKEWSTSIFFNASGQIIKIAARYHP